MIVMKRIVPFLLLIVSLHKVNGYLDENGVPKEGIFGYRGIQKNLYCLITVDWSREKKMLEAFDNVLKPDNADKAEDLKTFKEKFYPEDCGRHPRLVQQALESNRSDLIEFMKEKGLNIKSTFQEHCVDKAEQKTEFLKHPLHAIVQKHGNQGVALVSLMIRLGFDPKLKDAQGNTLFHNAAEKKSVKIIQALKEKINVNERNKQGKTAFLIAIEKCDQQAIDELVAQGAYSCLQDAKGNTSVHDAAAYANSTGLKYLEELAKTKDFDPNVANAEGETPLFVATKNKNKDGAAFLIAKGAKTGHKNNQEDTPLHIVARLQPPSAYEALFEELLKSMDFDDEIVDTKGKKVFDINNEQEECYCNPPKIGTILTSKEFTKRKEECSIIGNRKEKFKERCKDKYKKYLYQVNEEQNAETSRKNQEDLELVRKQNEEKKREAEATLARFQMLEADTQILEKKESEIINKNEEFEKTKNDQVEELVKSI